MPDKGNLRKEGFFFFGSHFGSILAGKAQRQALEAAAARNTEVGP